MPNVDREINDLSKGSTRLPSFFKNLFSLRVIQFADNIHRNPTDLKGL